MSAYSSRKRIALVTALIPLVLVTACAPTPSPSGSPTPASSVSSSPSARPTSSPEAPASPQPSPVAPAPDPVRAPVELLDARYDSGAIVVSAIIPDRVADGDCVLSVNGPGGTAEVSVPSSPDATVTYCASVTVALPAQASGTWDYQLEYSDSTSSGTLTGTVHIR